LDFDIRFVRNDAAESAVDLTLPAENYFFSKSGTIAIMQHFCDMGAAKILVATIADITANDVSCRVIDENHFNHFHVQFPDPDGVSN